jgi:carbamoyltransferase
MNIIGISAFYHDSAACLIIDGKIIAAAQEERLTRIKHDHRFPINSIRYCIEHAKIKIKDIDFISFYDKPFIKFERILNTYLAYAPFGVRSFLKSIPLWMNQKLWIRELIRKELAYTGEILFLEHHESHAASAFFPSPYQDAAFLTMDGVGEWATTSFGIGEKNKIRILGDTSFPHSLGLLYSAFTFYTGFKVNSGEYKLMGLAPFGEPKYTQLILNELIDLKEDGSFRLNMKYFDYPVGLKMTSGKFAKLFGRDPRKPETAISQLDMDLARSIQEVTEMVVLRSAKFIRGLTNKKNLCLAGGVALNCVANGKLLKAGFFDDVWIQPAAGDAGGALGAALFTWYQYLDHGRKADGVSDKMQGSYLGPEFNDEDIKSFLDSKPIPYQKCSPEEIVEKVSDLLASENVIGWFQGRMEFGPRALGKRSIIGDARSEKMQEIMNLKIKFREGFRPFAPSVLSEKVSEYFELEHSSPYMLLVAPVQTARHKKIDRDQSTLSGLDALKEVRSDIPAVTHVDYSARIQTVHKETNELYHMLISAFDRKYQCSTVINTSFNVRGEPIVCSPDDAYRCFMRTNMDILVLGNFLLVKKEQPVSENDEDWKKEFILD